MVIVNIFIVKDNRAKITVKELLKADKNKKAVIQIIAKRITFEIS